VCRFLQHHEEQLHEEKIDDAMSVGSQNSPSSEGPKPLDSTDSDTQPTAVSTSSETTDVADEDDEEEIAAADDDDDISMEPPPQPDDTSDEFNPWQFIKALPPYDLVRRRGKMATAALPPKRDGDPEKTIVLDLDETLVHCTVEGDGSAPPPDMTFPVTFHGITYTVHVQLRPHLHAFLQALKGRYEVVVFTASQKVYADELLNRLDPGTY
jgi:CTD small phosphatase-like protein 2